MIQPADPPAGSPAHASGPAKPGDAGPTESKASLPAGALHETLVPGASAESAALDGAKSPSFLIPEGSAPKPAEWKIQPAQEEWCPAVLSAKYPELKRHEYEDNYVAERTLANSWRLAGATRRGRIHAHQGTH